MAYQGADDLFNDGWREPGDDCERFAHYLLFAIGTLAGFGMLGSGFWGLVHPAPHSGVGVNLCVFVMGIVMAGGGSWIFVHESRHWDLRHLTADRFIAGGFLFGFALILLGLQIGSHSGRAGSSIHPHGVQDLEAGFRAAGWLIGLGSAVVTMFLLVGLAFAYAPALRLRRRIAGTRIERRYAVDDKLNEIDDHPCPRADGLTPAITLRLRDGRTRTMVCAESTYEIVRVGRQGTAVVRASGSNGSTRRPSSDAAPRG